ncbi:MAG: endonuclease/exonuclease/phosphatase family protein [Prevotellaceae bacterium]|jgi:endonuclease/exonuclease/phosphatase family metal-dependent hydrolase|nr:endonuclease/exonuclease/phosphatase family protein [Prevotellaceae bacterium]
MKHIKRYIRFFAIVANLLCVALLLLTAYSPHIHPTLHPVASCLGLVFPLLLLLNLGFVLFWVLTLQFKWLLIPLVGIAACWPQVRTYIPLNTHKKELPADCIKLLTYNIMGFDGITKDKAGNNPILDYLVASKADILCLQEYRTSSSSKYLTQADVEQALKAYPYHNIQDIGSQRGHTNRIACYSKFPILSARKLDLESSYNGSVMYEIVLQGDTVTLINNHLESNKLTKADKVVYEEILAAPGQTEQVKSGARLLIGKLAEASVIRAVQADSVARQVKTSRHPYVIVCGDFNDTPISYTHRVIARGLKDAFAESGQGPGISFNQNKFYFRIDHILTSRNFRAYNCTVDRSINVSDHYPMWCYLEKKRITP